MPDLLLIEDDPLNAEVLRAMLEGLGHRVHAAATGRDAVKLVGGGFRPTLVLTDILMPDMDGIEIVQHFTALLPGVPIIAMSGTPHGSYLRAAQLLGARRTLSKPFTLSQLEAVLREVLPPGPEPDPRA